LVIASDLIAKEIASIDPESTLSEAFAKMLSKKENALAVFESENFVGVISQREMLKRSNIYSNAKVKGFVNRHVPRLAPNDDLIKIASLMHHSGLRILPVFDNEKFLGLVHVHDVLNAMFKELNLGELLLDDIASEPFTLKASDKLSKLMVLMREKNIKQIPVLDAFGNFLGAVTLSSLIDKYFLHAVPKRELFSLSGHEPEAKKIFNVPLSELVEEVITAKPNQQLSTVKDLLCSTETIFLVEDKKLKGIVTTQDVLKAALGLISPERNIQLSNMPQLSDLDKKQALEKINRFYDKASKILVGNIVLSLHFKSHKKQGMRTKHMVKAKFSGPNIALSASSESWNFLSALETCLDTLLREIVKRHKKARA